MWISRLLNQTNVPVLEQVVSFTGARHRLLAENIVNADTPNYRQKDLSLKGFRNMLREQVDVRRGGGRARFDTISRQIENPRGGILFHDGNNRSMEELMTEQAKNALMHNLAVEMLRRQFNSLDNVLKERVS